MYSSTWKDQLKDSSLRHALQSFKFTTVNFDTIYDLRAYELHPDTIVMLKAIHRKAFRMLIIGRTSRGRQVNIHSVRAFDGETYYDTHYT